MKNIDRHRWDNLSDEEIDEIADASGEFPEVTEADLRRAVAVSAGGRVKVPISIRVDEEALDFFRAQGPGYQTRINSVLLSYARGELGPIQPPHAPARRTGVASVKVKRSFVANSTGGRITSLRRVG
jgi:uncharacterized protein (DUF4415 family)